MANAVKGNDGILEQWNVGKSSLSQGLEAIIPVFHLRA